MARFEVLKSIEARKLNPRSGLPLNEPPVTIPFSAIIENLKEDRDLIKFTWLGQHYHCAESVLRPAIKPLEDPGIPTVEAGRTEPQAGPPPEPDIRWEELRSTKGAVLRAKIPGGWLVSMGQQITFVPDATHAWDGKSIN
jgi:hypothetical protein